VIQFDPLIEGPKLLRRAVLWARRNRYPIPSLSDLARGRTVEDLTQLAKSWQQAGLGRVIEVSEDGRKSVHFSLNDAALASVDAAYRRSFSGRLRSISKSDWIAFGSLLVSGGALLVSILAYQKS